ncbi:ABC transporter permease [Streptomyces sp. AMCC400023]|uniref:ABC transporter permease n=1 Tax=Streptomyces sp. AMCC400023 TaxID=2056258 RepID=UPI001F00BD9D|nr:ABC transporter permease [Streptomyces sp. AMCC400023]UJV41556.1 ABC transporter permease [Streptomyces sp. AMCC400023]
MSALGRVVRAGVGRRRVRTVVTVLTTLMAVTASVLAVGLLVAARAPFERAFAEQRGAHLTGQFDGTKVTAARLAATADAPGVTAAAGPFPIVSVRPRTVTGSDFLPAGVDLPPMTVVGRAESGGPVDVIDLVEGEWATRPGQIVVAADAGPFRPGDRLAFPGTPGGPKLTVVGLARSVTGTGEAWVTPAQAESLAGTPHDTGGAGAVGAVGAVGGVGGVVESGNPPRVGGGAESGNSTGPEGGSAAYEMLYRFRQAATEADLAAARAAIVADVPEGAMSGARSYLTVRQDETANAMAFVPFLAAFGVLGLCLSVLVIGIVVGGAVGAATRRIGVLKALGFTPAQVVRAYVAQALVPAALGCVLGVVLGNALALPVLNEVGEAFGAPAGGLPVWVDVAVPGAALLLVAVAAVVPALRAGRLRTVEAIAVGGGAGGARGAGRAGPERRRAARAARAGRAGSERRRVPRLSGARPLSLLPPAVRLGLAQPFARPARSATVAAAVVFGALSVTFAIGLALTLGKVQEGRMLDSADSVVVEAGGPGGEREKADPAAVATVLRAQEGTRRFYGTAQAQVAVSGVTGATTVVAYEGDSAWGAPDMVSGHWLDGPGQAVVTGRFLRAAGIGVGDTVTLGEKSRRTTVRIVGEAFFTQDGGMTLLTSTATLAELGLGEEASPGRFHVRTASGTDQTQYLDALNRALDGAGLAAFAHADGGNSSSVIVAMDALIGTLTLMLVVVAGLGVLHTVVLDTRERVRDLGVLKALGMTPRQTVAMVVVSVAGVGLLAGLVAVPAGIVLHGFVTPFMGDAVGMTLPDTVVAVYDGPVLACLALGGLVIAVAGALLPAGWAAGTRTARALRTE